MFVFVGLLVGCAKSSQEPADGRDAVTTPDGRAGDDADAPMPNPAHPAPGDARVPDPVPLEPMGTPMSDSGSGLAPGALGVPPAPLSSPPMIEPPSARLLEKLKMLYEPDFQLSPTELAAAACGYVFSVSQRVETWKADQLTRQVDVTEHRVFDAGGRLLAATSSQIEPGWEETERQRLQIDYDASGRVVRWRRGVSFAAEAGAVAEFAYDDEGYTVDLAANEPQVVWRGQAGIFVPPTSSFCQRLRFDLAGHVTDEHWGCDEGRQGRAYIYDAEGQLVHVEGFGLFDVFGPPSAGLHFAEPDHWTIDIERGADQETTVWTELEIDEDGMVPVSRRLVRITAPDRVNVRFDREDDGEYDEWMTTWDVGGPGERSERPHPRARAAGSSPTMIRGASWRRVCRRARSTSRFHLPTRSRWSPRSRSVGAGWGSWSRQT